MKKTILLLALAFSTQSSAMQIPKKPMFFTDHYEVSEHKTIEGEYENPLFSEDGKYLILDKANHENSIGDIFLCAKTLRDVSRDLINENKLVLWSSALCFFNIKNRIISMIICNISPKSISPDNPEHYETINKVHHLFLRVNNEFCIAKVFQDEQKQYIAEPTQTFAMIKPETNPLDWSVAATHYYEESGTLKLALSRQNQNCVHLLTLTPTEKNVIAHMARMRQAITKFNNIYFNFK